MAGLWIRTLNGIGAWSLKMRGHRGQNMPTLPSETATSSILYLDVWGDKSCSNQISIWYIIFFSASSCGFSRLLYPGSKMSFNEPLLCDLTRNADKPSANVLVLKLQYRR